MAKNKAEMNARQQ
jgi:hypothetical protein